MHEDGSRQYEMPVQTDQFVIKIDIPFVWGTLLPCKNQQCTCSRCHSHKSNINIKDTVHARKMHNASARVAWRLFSQKDAPEVIDQRAVFFKILWFLLLSIWLHLEKTLELNNLCKSILWAKRTCLSNALGDARFKRIAHPEKCAKGDWFKSSLPTQADPSWHLAKTAFAANHVWTSSRIAPGH